MRINNVNIYTIYTIYTMQSGGSKITYILENSMNDVIWWVFHCWSEIYLPKVSFYFTVLVTVQIGLLISSYKITAKTNINCHV